MADDEVDELRAWREQARAWLTKTLPPKADQAMVWGSGDPDLAVFRDLPHDEEVALLDRIRAYRRARYDAGYGALTLPVEIGGAGLPASYASAFQQLERDFEVPPSTELISVTTGLVGAAVSVYGTDEQRERFAKALLRTDLLCCQLFSEPQAGSDLAGLATRAVRDGDNWVVDGQKVWTSQAHFADYGFLLARTDPDVVKQAGLTAFLVPMTAPGVEIRPIRQMGGASCFAEVFLTGVRVADALRVGAPGQGWEVATATLGFERSSSGSGQRRKGGTATDVVALAQALGVSGDPVVRQKLADLVVLATLQTATVDRVNRATGRGERPGAAAALGKLLASQVMTRVGMVAAELLGSRLVADTGEWGTFDWGEHVLGAPGYRLAGGTDEIQRTLIAERVLGLPAEQRVDKLPYSQLPRT